MMRMSMGVAVLLGFFFLSALAPPTALACEQCTCQGMGGPGGPSPLTGDFGALIRKPQGPMTLPSSGPVAAEPLESARRFLGSLFDRFSSQLLKPGFMMPPVIWQ